MKFKFLIRAPETKWQGGLPSSTAEEDQTSSIRSDESGPPSQTDPLLDQASYSTGLRKGHEVHHKPSFNAFNAHMNNWTEHVPKADSQHIPYYGILVENYPLLAMRAYSLESDTSLSNFLALLTNSVQREMADMWTYILPSLKERCTEQVSWEEGDDIKRWWRGFVTYFFAVGTAVENALTLVFKSTQSKLANLDSAKRRDITTKYHRCVQRLLASCELPIKAMEEKVQNLATMKSARYVLDVDEMWSSFAEFLLQMLYDAIDVACILEIRTKGVLLPGIQKKIIHSMLAPQNNRTMSAVLDHEANVLMSLTRWMGSEEMVAEWVKKFCRKRAVRNVGFYAGRYERLRRTYRFQLERCPGEPPRRLRRSPTKVTFSA